MKAQIVREKDCEVVLEVDISSDDIRKEMVDADKKLQGSVRIKGFRKGKAPEDMIRSRFTAERDETVIRSLIPAAVEKALEENNIQAITTPEISELKYDFEKNISARFKASVEIMPVFELKKYTGFKIKKEVKKITVKDVDEVIEKLRHQNANLVVSKKESADKESYAVIDYRGYLDGKPAKGFSASGQLIDLNGSFISGEFTEKIIGMKRGEKRKLSVTLADNYIRKDYAGKKIDFNVALNELKEKVLPAVDDGLTRSMGFKSPGELRDKVEKNLIRNEEEKYDESVRNEIIDRLIEWNAFTLPKSMVEREYDYLIDSLKQQYNKKSFSESEEKELREKYYPVAERRVRSSLIFSRVIEKEGIKVGEEDLEGEKKKAIGEGRFKADEVEKFFSKNADVVKEQVLTEKLFKFFIGKARIKKKNI